MKTILRAAVAAATLLGTVAVPALSQSQDRPFGRQPRGTFEYFVTSARLGDQSERGIGGRVLVPLARGGGSFLSRVEVGPFVAWRPETDRQAEVMRFGAQADVRPVAAIRVERARLEPVLSLAVGAVRGEESASDGEITPHGLTPMDVSTRGVASPESRVSSSLAVAPGIGARLRLLSGIALRGDLRRIVGPGGGEDGTELSGGLSLPL